MPIIPAANTFYRIVLEDLAQCLAIEGGSRDNCAKFVVVPSAASDSQLFSIVPHDSRSFEILAKCSGRNMDVQFVSTDAGAAIWQYHQTNAWNQRFQIENVGGGWYIIVACHSNRWIGSDPAAPHGVWQGGHPGDLPSAEGIRYRFVADSPSGGSTDLDLDAVNAQEFNVDTGAAFRKNIIAVVNKVPDAGPGLAFVLGYFWPETDPNKWLWDQMKGYVNALVKELVLQERVNALQDRLSGMRLNLQVYNEEPYGSPAKGGKLEALLTSLNDSEPNFCDKSQPQRTLPFFVAFATLHLLLLREECVSFAVVHGRPDPIPEKRLKDLRDKIAVYSGAADAALTAARAWRLTKIHSEFQQSVNPAVPSSYTMWDDYDGSNFSWRGTGAVGQTILERMVAGRKRERDSQFVAEMEQFLAPARTWRHLDPSITTVPPVQLMEFSTGPFGGLLKDEMPAAGGGGISAIAMYLKRWPGGVTFLQGIEVFDGGLSTGIRGIRDGEFTRLDLSADERIMGVAGSTTHIQGPHDMDVIESVYFTTSRGRIVGAGNSPGVRSWNGDPPPHHNASLARIKGRATAHCIEALEFVWQFLPGDGRGE